MTESTNNINDTINKAVDAYFETNPEINWFAAKKLMPALIENGVFQKDIKNGMPLRKVLRALDVKNELKNIPCAYIERVGENIYWYFLKEGATFVSNHVSDAPNAKQKRAIERTNNDEVYLIKLIDALLDKKGSRKHTFDYLLGDVHKNGKTRTELPIDLYYAELDLALEIVAHPEKKKDPSVISKEEKLTVSGITRAEQRLRYLNRKKTTLTKKGKFFVEIPLEKFKVNDSKQLVRDQENDESVLKELLSEFLK